MKTVSVPCQFCTFSTLFTCLDKKCHCSSLKAHSGIPHENGRKWTGMDWNGLEWTGMDWNGLDWKGLEGKGMACRTHCMLVALTLTTTNPLEKTPTISATFCALSWHFWQNPTSPMGNLSSLLSPKRCHWEHQRWCGAHHRKNTVLGQSDNCGVLFWLHFGGICNLSVWISFAPSQRFWHFSVLWLTTHHAKTQCLQALHHAALHADCCTGRPGWHAHPRVPSHVNDSAAHLGLSNPDLHHMMIQTESNTSRIGWKTFCESIAPWLLCSWKMEQNCVFFMSVFFMSAQTTECMMGLTDLCTGPGVKMSCVANCHFLCVCGALHEKTTIHLIGRNQQKKHPSKTTSKVTQRPQKTHQNVIECTPDRQQGPEHHGHTHVDVLFWQMRRNLM